MTGDIFAEVRSIEEEADRLIGDAEARRQALVEEADRLIDQARREAEQAAERRIDHARQEAEARQAEEQHRLTSAHAVFLERLEAVRRDQADALADWLVERLLGRDPEH